MPIAFLKKLGRSLIGSAAKGGSDPARPEARTQPPQNADTPRRRRRRRSGRARREGPAAAAPTAPADAGPKPATEVRQPAPKAWNRSDYVVPESPGRVRFTDLDLSDPVLHGIADCGFLYCTPVQAKILAEAGARDVTGRAQTGTGKTAAFLILTFEQFIRNPRQTQGEGGPARPRALVIAPTRELVVQIVEEAAELGNHAGMRSMAVYGGADMDRQARELAAGPLDLVAATPGRLLDFVSRRAMDLSNVEVFVVDEADRMLDMGFIPDVRRIVGRLPPKQRRRTMLFSATLTQDVRRLAASWMADPVVVEIEPEKVAVDTVEQIVYPVASRDKFTLLWNLLRKPGCTRVLVFTNRRDRTRHLTYQLHSHGIRCEMISGEVQQNRRLNLLKDFREGHLPVLIATDVAGRGIHVDDVSHVINYDFPYDAEDYVHRIGRTGRAGQAGTAVSFACEDESFVIPEIEKYIGRSLPCVQPPEDLLVSPPAPAASSRAPESGRPARGPSSGRPRHAGRPRTQRR